MRRRNIEVRPLSGAIGAEIHGLDLARDLEPDTVAEVRRIWLERCVVFFRGQTLSFRRAVIAGILPGNVPDRVIGKTRTVIRTLKRRGFGMRPGKRQIARDRDFVGVQVKPRNPHGFALDQHRSAIDTRHPWVRRCRGQ